MVHQGDKIFIPEGSALRQALAVMPAEAKPVNAKLTLPGTVESDPARTAVVLPALGGRLISLKARLGDRVVRGQILAVIDSPDLGQAYDDDAKAADTFHLTETNLERQEAQSKLGVLSDRDLDQARSDHAQAAAEYERTQARLKTLGVPLEPQGALGNGALRKGAPRLLTVIAPVSGSVTVLSVAEGAMINDPTQPIMTVADLSTVWVTALVAEKDMGLVYKDQDAQVTLLAYPDRLLSGAAKSASPSRTATTRSSPACSRPSP
jgi:cobalt-zinc-cadmium efflux system membrane fusion protein